MPGGTYRLQLNLIWYDLHLAICSVDPVHKEDFLHSVLTACYPNDEPSLDTISADRLSVLFMVFCVGAFFDFDQPLVPRESEEYYILGRAAMCVRPIYDHPTVYAIQSMVCPGSYVPLIETHSV